MQQRGQRKTGRMIVHGDDLPVGRQPPGQDEVVHAPGHEGELPQLASCSSCRRFRPAGAPANRRAKAVRSASSGTAAATRWSTASATTGRSTTCSTSRSAPPGSSCSTSTSILKRPRESRSSSRTSSTALGIDRGCGFEQLEDAPTRAQSRSGRSLDYRRSTRSARDDEHQSPRARRVASGSGDRRS